MGVVKGVVHIFSSTQPHLLQFEGDTPAIRTEKLYYCKVPNCRGIREQWGLEALEEVNKWGSEYVGEGWVEQCCYDVLYAHISVVYDRDNAKGTKYC